MRAGALAKEIAARLSPVSDCAAFEARILLQHYCKLSLSDIYLDKELGTVPARELEEAITQRLAHRPLQYILGEWEFMGNAFIVNESVLIPRPETELLVECMLEQMQPTETVYDLCAGSGCVAISVAKSSGAQVYAVEKYPQALEVLRRNIARHQPARVAAVEWDITQKPGAEFAKADYILSNPPYVENALLEQLQSEVRREPATALAGGEDGLDFYRAIAANFIHLLKAGGYAAFEIGEGQEPALKEIFRSLRYVRTIADYNSIARVVIFRKEA